MNSISTMYPLLDNDNQEQQQVLENTVNEKIQGYAEQTSVIIEGDVNGDGYGSWEYFCWVLIFIICCGVAISLVLSIVLYTSVDHEGAKNGSAGDIEKSKLI